MSQLLHLEEAVRLHEEAYMKMQAAIREVEQAQKEEVSEEANKRSFELELTQLINKYSLESGSNTPDYILAQYLVSCLENFNEALSIRDQWHSGTSVELRVTK